MTTGSMAANGAARFSTARLGAFATLATAATLLLGSTAVNAAGSESAVKESPVRLESVSGSDAKRITLTAKAAERLGIATGKVSEEPVVRKQMVGGIVVSPQEIAPESKLTAGLFSGFGTTKAVTTPTLQPVAATASASAAGDAWILVTLPEGEWDRLAKDQPVRILPLATREMFATEVMAAPSGQAPVEDPKRAMLNVYYILPGQTPGLTSNTRVRVEMLLTGNNDMRKTVPYSAVYYDATGQAWVYVTSEPLVYQRQPIVIDTIEGDKAYLTDGPPAGTDVVSVGAALLYGTEVFGK